MESKIACAHAPQRLVYSNYTYTHQHGVIIHPWRTRDHKIRQLFQAHTKTLFSPQIFACLTLGVLKILKPSPKIRYRNSPNNICAYQSMTHKPLISHMRKFFSPPISNFIPKKYLISSSATWLPKIASHFLRIMKNVAAKKL